MTTDHPGAVASDSPFVRLTVSAPGGQDTLDVFLNVRLVNLIRPCPHDRFGADRWELWLADGKMLAVSHNDARRVADAKFGSLVDVTDARTGGTACLDPGRVRFMQVAGAECEVCLRGETRLTIPLAEAEQLAAGTL